MAGAQNDDIVLRFHFEFGRKCMLRSDIAANIKHFFAAITSPTVFAYRPDLSQFVLVNGALLYLSCRIFGHESRRFATGDEAKVISRDLDTAKIAARLNSACDQNALILNGMSVASAAEHNIDMRR